jgi:hypothetical protein
MSQHRKHRGYASQKIVAEYLAAHGFPYAESTGAGRTGTDITGTPGLDWEVKARRNLNLTGLIHQMRERSRDGVPSIAVVRPDGTGPATIADWPAVLPLSDLCDLLRDAGYGDPRN